MWASCPSGPRSSSSLRQADTLLCKRTDSSCFHMDQIVSLSVRMAGPDGQSPVLGSRNDPVVCSWGDLCCLSQFLEAKLIFVLYPWDFLYPGLYSLSAQIEIHLEALSVERSLARSEANTEWLFPKPNGECPGQSAGEHSGPARAGTLSCPHSLWASCP